MIAAVYAAGVLWAIITPPLVQATSGGPTVALASVLSYLAGSSLCLLSDWFARRDSETHKAHMYRGGWVTALRHSRRDGTWVWRSLNTYVSSLANSTPPIKRNSYDEGLIDAYRATDSRGRLIHNPNWRPTS